MLLVDVCGTVESVKAAADIYTPLAGTIKTVNEELSDNPSLINESPTEKGYYSKGWVFFK